MPHRNTRVAIKQAINQALNATQEHKGIAIKQAINPGCECHTGTQG